MGQLAEKSLTSFCFLTSLDVGDFVSDSLTTLPQMKKIQIKCEFYPLNCLDFSRIAQKDL